MDEAMADTEIRALYFTANVTLANTRKGGEGDREFEEPAWKQPKTKGGKGNGGNDPTKIKGKTKASGKGKGHGKNQGTKGGFAVCGSTSDGRLLCYKFNEGSPCDGSCGMLHLCRIADCWDTHPMIEHPGFDVNKKCLVGK